MRFVKGIKMPKKKQLKAKTYCIAVGCKNNDKNSTHSFFGLPSGRKKTERCLKWLTLVGREDLIDKKNKHSYRVCSAHFDMSSMKTITTLKDFAVPTLLLPNQPQEKPSCSTKESVSTCCEDAGISPSETIETQTSLTKITEIENKSVANITISKIETKDVEKMPENKVLELPALPSTEQLTEGASRKRKLSDELKESKSKLRKLNHDFIKIKKELELKNNPVTCSDPDEDIVRRFQKLMDWQLKYKYKGNQHDADYKLFALNLHYASPRAYRCLQTVLKLPSKCVLSRFKLLIPPSLDSEALDSLALKIKSLPESAKYCTISVHEITLKRNLFYNITYNEVIGFHNVNCKTSLEIASKAFIIMLQGIYFNWNQPITYALMAPGKHYEDIDIWLNKVISKLSTLGIKVKALVSDQGTNFEKFAKDVHKVTLKKPFFIYDNTKIYYIFDVPQLMKCIRDKLLTYDFVLDGKKISWDYITELYNDQKQRNLRLVPRLTEAHVHPKNNQNSVQLALQILSRTVGAALNTYIDLGKLSEEARPTAVFIESMNYLFDVLNSSSLKCNSYSQAAFRLSKDQENILNSAKEMFASLKAIDRITGENNTEHMGTIENFKMSIQSILMLFEDLRKDGFEYLLTQRLNQANLENFFSSVRQQGGSCSEPTPIQLQRAFSKLLVRSMTKNTPNTNCEMDICDVLLKVEDTIKMICSCSNLSRQSGFRRGISVAGVSDYRMELPDENALIYVSSYLFFKCAKEHNCSVIQEILSCHPDLHETNLFCSYNKRASFFNSLKMPPKPFLEYIENLESVFAQNLEKMIKRNPGGKLIKLFRSVTPQTPCSCFPVEYLLKLFTRFRIYEALRFNNRHLKHGENVIKNELKVSHL